MADENPPKKDLTGILELSQSSPGELPADPALFAVNEVPATSPIETFESLEELSKTEPPFESADPSPEWAAPSVSATEILGDAIEVPAPEPEAPAMESAASIALEAPIEVPTEAPTEAPAEIPAPVFSPSPPEKYSEPAVPDANPMAKVRNFSENVALTKAAAQVALPFSLRITGRLDPQEREKLVDLLSSLGIGISAVDMEPQFESGKVLIPRISEYSLVAIVQAMRGTSAEMRFGPSDLIFATADTRDESEPVEEVGPGSGARFAGKPEHAAEDLPITTDAHLPGVPRFNLIDTITASAALKTEAVEAQHSNEYQEVLENLQREIKYKAFHRGAIGVINFTVQLTQLSLPMHYRLVVMGTAIKRGPPPIPRA